MVAFLFVKSLHYMQIDIITLFPELLKSPFEASILKRAIKAKKVLVNFHMLRDYAENKHKQIDDYPFGGGAGMVMKIEPIDRCISELKKETKYGSLFSKKSVEGKEKIRLQKKNNTTMNELMKTINCQYYA